MTYVNHVVLVAVILGFPKDVRERPHASQADAVLYNFAGGTNDAASPYGNLVQAGNTLYGTSSGGGGENFGALYSYNLASRK